jgi:hypothetical protein
VLTDPGKRLIDEAIGRHVANEERLLLSLTEVEQETERAKSTCSRTLQLVQNSRFMQRGHCFFQNGESIS